MAVSWRLAQRGSTEMARAMIGIIGGAGVAASAALVTRITDIVTDDGARFDQDHPELVLFQATQAPSRSLFIEGRGPSFVPAYLNAAQRLRAFGAEIIVMCCNTAHVAIDELRLRSGLHFVSLIDETVLAVRRDFPKARRVGILSSDGTRQAMLYDNAVSQMAAGVSLIYPSAEMQSLVTQGIIGVKRGMHRRQDENPAPRECFDAAARQLADDGAEVVVLACTEIPLAFGSGCFDRTPVIDTIDVLARASLSACGFDLKGRLDVAH
jgi:aspartate racemase